MKRTIGKATHALKKMAAGLGFVIVFATVGFLLARVALFSGPYLPTDMMSADKSIIDLHVHTACIEDRATGCFISKSLRESFRFPLYLRAFMVEEEQLKTIGNHFVVNKLARQVLESRYLSHAVILAIDGAIDENGELDYEQTEIYVPNKFVADAIKSFPQLLLGASINPMRTNALTLLEDAKKDGAVLIKWLPSIQNFDPADKRLIPFYQKLVQLDLPLLTHTGHERAFSRAHNDYADPQRLTLPLEQGVTVIAAHAASTGQNEGQDNMTRLYELMARYPNLYTELSSLTQLNKISYMKKLLNKHGYIDRVAYGSDMPLINTALVSPFYYPMQLTIDKMIEIQAVENAFDRDIELKLALGVPSRVFYLSRILIESGLPPQIPSF